MPRDQQPFIVEHIEFDDLGHNEGRVSVRVRRYPAGPTLEFDLSDEVKEEVLKIVLDAHAVLAFQLAKEATNAR